MKPLSLRPFLLPALLVSLIFSGAHALNAAEAEKKEKGVWIDRDDGTKINLLVEDLNFELHFYDKEKNKIEPDAAQAVLHYTSRVIQARETLALLPARKEEDVILTSPRTVRPPFQFDILLVLNFDEADKKPESHHMIFQQEADSAE